MKGRWVNIARKAVGLLASALLPAPKNAHCQLKRASLMILVLVSYTLQDITSIYRMLVDKNLIKFDKSFYSLQSAIDSTAIVSLHIGAQVEAECSLATLMQPSSTRTV